MKVVIENPVLYGVQDLNDEMNQTLIACLGPRDEILLVCGVFRLRRPYTEPDRNFSCYGRTFFIILISNVDIEV